MGNVGRKLTKQRKYSNSSNVATTNSNKEKFRFIDGRRYHNVEDSKYSLPNDDKECDRLHMQHFVLRCVWQGNFASPVERILKGQDAKVLDSGYVSL